MNKKIKIIDVINKIANEEIPKEIKYHNKIYKYVKSEEEEGYLNTDFGGDWLINIVHWDDIKELNQEVEILEDNTEEIEELPEIDIQNKNETNWEEIGKMVGKMYLEFAKGFNNALEQLGIELDNQINNK